jgi:hypothetical protein
MSAMLQQNKPDDKAVGLVDMMATFARARDGE